MRRFIGLLIVGALLSLSEPVVAGTYEDGVAAYQRQDYATASRLWGPLAVQGLGEAQFCLGLMYEYGQGVAQDHAEAVKWYRKAADQGLAIAQTSLADMYYTGRGVPRDRVEYERWLRKATDQGYADAQYKLGLGYRFDLPPNYVESTRWLRMAADQGHARAQAALGNAYSMGWGVPEDYVQAHMWANLAAAQGDRHAVFLRDTVMAAIMTRDQLAEAQKLARQWKPSTPSAMPPSQIVSIPPSQIASTGNSLATSVPMKQEGGTFVVPVLINNAINLNFVVDSGAADVTIPSDVVAVMIRSGTLTEKDFGAKRTYILADGSKVESRTFRIRSLKVGDRLVENVLGSEAHAAGTLLLGQSFLGKFKSWSIDNTKHALMLE